MTYGLLVVSYKVWYQGRKPCPTCAFLVGYHDCTDVVKLCFNLLNIKKLRVTHLLHYSAEPKPCNYVDDVSCLQVEREIGRNDY